MEQGSLTKLVESKVFERLIISIILVNAVILGLETDLSLSAETMQFLMFLDKICLGIFTVELLVKFLVYRTQFFRDPWRVFDFVVVGISLIPASGPFSVVRSLRVLRTLRMVSVIPSLKKVVVGLLGAVPGLSSVGAIMVLIFYVGAVIATKLFGTDFPQWFGSLGASAYTLFQVMTLESWSMGIVRPVMDKFPYAWLFFLPFILIATFTMLNLFIAVIVNAMQAETEKEAESRAEKGHDERTILLNEVRELKRKLDSLHSKLT